MIAGPPIFSGHCCHGADLFSLFSHFNDIKLDPEVGQEYYQLTGKALARHTYAEIEAYIPESKFKLAACAPKNVKRRAQDKSVPSSLNKFGGAVNAIETPSPTRSTSSSSTFSGSTSSSSASLFCPSASSSDSSDAPRHSLTGTGRPLAIKYPEPQPDQDVFVTHSRCPLRHKVSNIQSDDGGATQ